MGFYMFRGGERKINTLGPTSLVDVLLICNNRDAIVPNRLGNLNVPPFKSMSSTMRSLAT